MTVRFFSTAVTKISTDDYFRPNLSADNVHTLWVESIKALYKTTYIIIHCYVLLCHVN